MIEVGSKPVVVTALGAQDGGNWTASTIQVGLWDSEGSTLIAYAFVSNSSPAEAGGYRYSPITPVTLQANTRYIIGALGGTGYANFYDGNNATLPFTSGDSNITIVVSTYNESDFFSAPTWTAGGGAGGVRWAFANFKFDSGRQLVVWGNSPITTHPVMNAGVSQAVIASQSVDTNVIAVLKYGGVTTWSLTGDPVSALDAPESTLADVVLLAAGEEHFLALKKDGQVVAWGRGFTDEGAVPNFGQSDVPYDASSGMVAVAAGDYHSLALRKDGRVFAWGWDNYNQCQVPDAAHSGVVAIAAGRYTSFALKFDGTLVSWGRGSYGATLPADATNGVVAISAGRQHAMALKSDGTVKAWGTNAEGQVTTATGSPAGLSGVTSVAAGRYYSMALKSDRTVQAWGESGYISDSFTAPAALANVVSIQGGRNHGLAIVSDGPAPRLDMPLGPLQILAGSATNLPLKSTVPSPIFSQVGLPAGVALSPAGALSVSNTVASTNVFARIMVENSNGSDARVVKLQITGNTNPIFAANFNDFTGTPTDKQYQTDHDLVSGANLAGWTKTGTDAARLVNHGAAVADWAVMIYSDDTITMASGVDANVNGVVYRVSLDVGPSADKNNSHSTRADEILRVLVLDGEGTEIAGLPVSPGAWAGSQTFVRRTFTYTGNGNGAVCLKLAAANPSASRIAGSVDNITIAVAEADSDGDGYSNELENSLGTDPDLMDPAPTTVGSDFSFDVAWAGDSNFAATGLPAGLTISTTTGRISGVPLGVTAGQGAVVTVTGDSAAGGPQTRKLVIRVDKGSLTLSGITATAIPVSQTLSTSVIEGAAKNASGVTVAGNWEFRNNANKPLAGANSYSVIFRPADGDNYHDAYGIVSVTGTATPLPSVTFLPPLSLVYDNTAKTFTASASGVSGFSYEYRGRNSTIYAATDVAPVNAGDYVVKATSTDPNYSGSAEQDFTITKAPVTLTLGGLNQTYNGSPKLVTVTPNPVGVSFTVQYDGGSTPPRNAGNYPVLVTVTDPNYTGSKSDTLVVAKADPVINTPPTISAITYGETLGAATFTGGAFSPTGTFAFVSPGTTPPAGIGQNFDVLFTPTDTDNYNTGTRTMAITVNPAPLTITGISIANKPFDGTKAATITGTASYAGLVNGETFAVTGTPTAVFLTPDVGNGKAVEVNGYTAPSANYALTQPAGLTANITAGTADTDGDGFSDADETSWGMDPNAKQTAVYDFNSLAIGNLNGQDGWRTSIYGSAGDGQVVTWASNGTKAVQYAGSGSNFGVSGTRLNNAAYRFPKQGSGKAIVEIDVRPAWWGMVFGMGLDANGDGLFSTASISNRSTSNPDMAWWVQVLESSSSWQFYSKGTGTTTTGNAGSANTIAYARVRVVLDYAANGGSGSASVFVRDLAVANSSFSPVSGLQNLNLGLNLAATGLTNPQNWNGLGFHIEGATGVLDNLSVSNDTDGDGLADSIENNSRTYVSAGNPGTSPFLSDTDGDGLNDGVETNTGTFVSATNTGTDPHKADTDGDGVNDGAEVSAGTDPIGTINFAGSAIFPDSALNFTSSGTLRFSVATQVPVEYLVVAGGGAGGGRDVAGGGGAGGVLDNVGGTPLLITGNTNLAVTVGAGGTGVSDASGNNGGNSALGSITAVGGGGGGYYTANGQAGGSGGGGGRQAPSAAAGGAGTAGQGNPGGSGANGSTESHSGGGGGGAGAAGQAGSITAGGRGGDGRKVSITGTDVYYGGGGGGSGHRNTSATVISGQGGQGGGGAAAFNGNAVPIAGQANTGGGGGASRNAPGAVGFSGPTAGANGGSGVVMVRYPGGALGTGGTISPLSVGGTNYTLHSFTNTGSATLALTNLSVMGVRLTGVISGPGGIRHQGPGTLTLASASTYSGTTVIDAGATLQLDDGGSLGAGNVTNNGTLVFNRTDTNTFANLISGTGAVWQIGAGTTILTGANSYSGGTLVSDGVLEVGDGGTGGSLGSGPITNNKAVVWNKSSDETYSMLISGTGRFRKSGDGTLTLATTNTYTGPTVVHKGTLKLTQITGHVGNTGYRPLQGTITVQSMGTLTFATNYYNQLGANANGFTQPLTPVILDGGTIESGQTVTTFTNLVINGGKLLGMGGFGNPWGAFVLLGTVNVTADASFEAVSGTDNSITPGAWVGNETVTFQVANGANLTNGLPIEDYGAGNVYSVTKTGGGTLFLNATNTYTGATTVNEGVLSVGSTGRINGGTVTVNSGAQVEGSGAINALSIASGGVLKISSVATNSAGAWNTGGSITFASGATVDANAGSLSTEQTHYLIRGSSISGTPTVLNSANFTVSTAGGNLTLIPKDTDGDGLSDFAEGQLGTNPSLTDTDGDGLSDKQETDLGTNPSAADSDGDGLNDNVETGTGTFAAGPGGTQLPVTFTIVTNKITDASDGGTLTSTNGGSMSGKIMNGTAEAGEWFLSDFRYTRKAVAPGMTLTAANFATNGTAAGNPYGRAGVGMDMNNGGAEPHGVMKFSYQVRLEMKPGYRAGKIFLLGKNPTAAGRSYGPQSNSTIGANTAVGTIQASGFAGTGTVLNPSNNLATLNGTTFPSGQLLPAYYNFPPTGQDSGSGDYANSVTAWALEVPAANPVSFSVDFTAGTKSASSEATAFSVQVFREDTGSNPLLADSDGDGVNDGAEVAAGKDPNLAPRAEIRLAALSTGYIVTSRQSNAGELDWSSTTGSMAVGSQRSPNGSADAGNQRAGAGFATFRLTSPFLTALSKPGAKFYVELKVDGIGGGTGGVPYTDGLDLRYYGVRDNALLPIDYYNAAGTGGDQSDIVATTASTGVRKVELTQASAISQIPTGAVGQHVGFGFLNSAGVNTSVPVGNSFAETYSFNVSAVPSDFALVVSLPDNDEDGLADAFETNTGTYVSATDTGSDPAKADTDGDGVNDGAEVAAGTNPLVKNTLRFRPIDMLALGKGNFSIPESNVVGGGVTPTGFVYSSSTNAAYYGGVPFFVTDKANQVWHAAKAPGGDGTGVVSETFPIAVNDVYGFYTMAGLWWGAAGSYVTYTFNFSDGSSYSKILTNNVDLRDFNIPSIWANSINGTTTQNVFAAGTYHLDRQWIDLAAAGHGGKNLVSFTVTDSGSWGSSRIFLAAATAQVGASGQIPPGATDTDGDGILDSFELGLPLSTKPDDADTDDDGLTDGLEISGTTDPLVADTDGDGLNDGVETKTGTYVSASNTGTDPAKADTDGDGLNDNVETASGTFVSAANPGTNPNLADSDGDGVNDGAEIAAGTSPVAKPAFPAGTFAVDFNGISTQRVIDDRPVQDDFTLAFWIKTTAAGTGSTHWFEGRGLLDGEVGGVTNDFGTSLMAGGKVGFGVGNPDITLISAKSVNDNAWRHVAVTREATTGAMKIYIDGVLDRSGTGPTGTKNAPPRLTLGSLQTDINYFAGEMADFRIYDRVIGATDIWLLANRLSVAGAASKVTLLVDTDNDGLDDAIDPDPTKPDTDGDGLTDGQEVNTYGSNPSLADTDGDGVNDKAEVDYGTSPTVSTVFNRLINGSFEDGPDKPSSGAIQTTNVIGWKTSATDRMIELWASGFLGSGGNDGAVLAELNAFEVSTLYQDVTMTANSAVSYSFLHRGRDGTDVMEFRLDRLAGGPGSAVEANFFSRTVSTGMSWVRYHGTPPGTVEAGRTYRFSYSSITPAGSTGNLLDAAFFEIDRDADGLTDSVETNTGTYVSATNTGTDPLDDDSDNDGLKDGEEVFTYTTVPTVADSDTDGAPDGVEVTAGSDPKLASSVPKPSISSQPVATTGTVGGSASFTVTAANPAGVTAGPTYQWKKNGEDIPGETASTLTLPLLAIDSEGAYSVVVANAYGSLTSTDAVLTVNKATPVIETAPLAGTITYGEQLSAALLAGGVAKVGALEVEGFFSFDSGDFKPAAGTANQDVTFTPLDPDSYNTATLKVSVTVAKKALTVRANDQTRFYGQANPTFTVTYTGLVAGETSITPAPSVTTSANAGSLPGSYAIEVIGPAQTNYDVTFVNGTLTVRDGDQDGDGVGDSAELAAGTDPANPADRPMVLSAGWNHTLFVPVPGQTALAWGINTDGRCGLGHTNSPVTSGVEVVGEDGVTKLSNVIAVAAGGNHSLILTRSGSALQVWAAGTNGNGQLGLTNAGTDRFRPILSGLPTNITAVAAGARHSLALAADGKLYAWGDNISGQVGVNTNRTVIRMPTLVTNLGAVTLKAVRAGAEHSLALDADGKVWSWGRPNGGALGYEGISPVRAPQMVTALTKKIAQIAAGDRHSLFLTEDGEVYASGINTAAQLGLPASVTSTSIPTKLTFPAGTRIKKLVAGLNRAHAIATDGKVYAWGYNRFGELGLGFASNADPFAVFVPTEVPSLFGSTEIAGGGFQTFALDSSGTLLASGFNEGGQLGVGSTENVTTAPAPTKEAGKSDQTLTFNISALTNSTATSIVLNASATSGLTPVYTSSAPAVAAVEGSSLRFLTAGTVRITATQSGNELYNAAAPVTRELTVVRDTTLPVVTLNGPATVSLYVGDIFTDPGASALDPADGLLTNDIFVTGTVNTAVVGTYTLTYQVQDAAGNLGQAVRTVVVSEPPPLTLQLAATPAEMTYQPVGTNEVAVDSGLQILGRPSITLTAATVKIVSGRQTGDRLALSGYSGPVTASYNSSSGTLRLSGTTNLAGYQEALRKVVLATTNRTFSSRVITMALGTGIAFTNGHVYEFVSTAADWPTARNAAKARQIHGEAGYLANSTSAEENAFLLGLLQEVGKDAWLGGSDTAGTGYRWFDGPEAGTLFWNGVGSGGSAVAGQYSNWGAGEPNDFGWSTGFFSTTYESYAMMTHSTSFVIGGWTRSTSPGKWNDAPIKTSSSSTYRLGYLVEYGSSSTTGLRFAAARTIEVVKATPLITALPTATAITTGQALNTSTLSGGAASVPGTFAWSVPTTVPPEGTNHYGVTFTPTDTANYEMVALEVPVTAESAPTGPLFASYYNDTYPFSPTVPTLTIVGSNLDLATKGFKLVNTTPLMGEFNLSVLSMDPSQVTLGLPTSMPSGTYYVIYDSSGADEKILGYLNSSSFAGGGGMGGGTGSGTGGGGGMGPASVPDAMTLAEPSLTLSSASGGITTLSVGPATVQMLFSYNRPEGGSYVDGRYAVDGLWYEVQQSTNLGSWAGVAAQEVGTIPLENGWERVTVRVSASGNQAFLRLKISN